MSEQTNVAVTLPADVNQIDESGYVWAFLSGGRSSAVGAERYAPPGRRENVETQR